MFSHSGNRSKSTSTGSEKTPIQWRDLFCLEWGLRLLSTLSHPISSRFGLPIRLRRWLRFKQNNRGIGLPVTRLFFIDQAISSVLWLASIPRYLRTNERERACQVLPISHPGASPGFQFPLGVIRLVKIPQQPSNLYGPR